ncbi:uncharacterized protein F5147DRAFT_820851 [Suillus discolor]|uniref:Uncharacterized protein n=1 Tax=Suillus discolor TaxID=1912936 RepID=A0A9P7EVT9_9AGAM|nr:uncharacterized protein F5147DRAFT_820851 [Suillus discolor]KAG2093712.1 hypothetical protein F5147DRAFT_820851 [Suillus discolor]
MSSPIICWYGGCAPVRFILEYFAFLLYKSNGSELVESAVDYYLKSPTATIVEKGAKEISHQGYHGEELGKILEFILENCLCASLRVVEDASPSKTITRGTRRQYGLLRSSPACDDMGITGLDAVGVSPSMKCSSSLRPRTAPAPTSSALPKYRPRSTLIESVLPKKPVSPPRSSTRRQPSSSEEEDKVHSLRYKGSMEEKRPKSLISPLPHKALTVKVYLPNLTPLSTPSKICKLLMPKKTSPAKVESARPGEIIKIKTISSASKSNIARPLSSSSSHSSVCSQSLPQTPSKSGFGFGHSKNNQMSSPLRSTGRPAPESPLAHHTRQNSTMVLGRSTMPTPLSHLAEEDSEDSIEADGVGLLLSPVAPLEAPTPAIPRIWAVQLQHNESEPEMPLRPSQFLPTRANLSYLSPVPLTSQSTPGLRPPKAHSANCSSIMSWEQLANDGSQMIIQEEVEKMFSEIQATFMPVDPSLNLWVNILCLQVASTENTVKECFVRSQELEEQLHAPKHSHVQETEELTKQVSFLEQQLHISVEARERLDEEHSAFTASLQDQLRCAEASSKQASNTAFAHGQEEAAVSWAELLNQKQQK